MMEIFKIIIFRLRLSHRISAKKIRLVYPFIVKYLSYAFLLISTAFK